jgi:hypothetical protein
MCCRNTTPIGWTSSPQVLRRLLLSLDCLKENPNSPVALGYCINLLPHSEYRDRFTLHAFAFKRVEWTDATGVVTSRPVDPDVQPLDPDLIRYTAAQQHSDYQFIVDTRWSVVTGFWTLLLSTIAGIIAGTVTAKLGSSCC